MLLGLLGMMAVSCEDELPTPQPQENEPGALLTTGNIVGTAEGIMTEGTPITLADYQEPTGLVPVFKVDKIENLPAGAVLSFPMEISNTADFNQSVILNTLVGESGDDTNVYYADVKEWNAAQLKLFGSGSTPMTTYYRIPVYVNLDGSDFRYQSPDFYIAQGSVPVKRIVTKVVEDSYYLVGNFCDWDLTKAIKMNNTVPGTTDVYANPIFSVKVDITDAQVADGYKFMIVPESTVTANNWNLAYGCKPDSVGATAGALIEANAADTDPGVISLAGPMLITADIEEGTYSFAYALDQLYAFTSTKNPWILHTDDYMNYEGVAVLGTVGYFGQEPRTSGTILFKQDPNSEPNTAVEGVVSGDLVSSGGNNIKMPFKGNNFYMCQFNLAGLTYTVSHIETLSIVGDGNGWDEKNAPVLTPSSDFRIWTAKGIEIGTKFKVNANHAWTLDFGGSASGDKTYEIRFKGANMESTPGTYDVEINFGVYPYTLTLK